MTKQKVLFLLTLAWASSAQAGESGLFYKTQPADPDHTGSEGFYTDAQRRFATSQLIYGEEDSSEVAITLTAPPDFTKQFPLWPTTTILRFAAPEEAPLAVGTYPNASSALVMSQPRLDISGAEFGYCSDATGSFDVREIVFDPSVGAVTRFAADFVTLCSSTSTTIEGSVRYNSDVPFPPDVPLAIGSDVPLNADGCFEATSMVGRHVELHVVNGTNAENYEWSAEVEGRPIYECPPLTLCLPSMSPQIPILRTLGGDGDRFAFDLENVNDYEQAKVLLSATDGLTGEVEQVRLSACVSDSMPPAVTINSPREGEHIVGNNFIVDVSLNDSVDPEPSYLAKLGPYPIRIEPGKVIRVEVPEPLRRKGEPIETTLTVRARDASFNWSEASVNVTVVHDMRK